MSKLSVNAPPAAEVFNGKFNNAQSRSYLSKLRKLGEWGPIAAELFQSAKAEERSMSYRGGTESVTFSKCSEERCRKALLRLTELLGESELNPVWGWLSEKWLDLHVLCIETPVGQVCRFYRERLQGPAFRHEWDYEGRRTSRILQLCNSLLEI